MTDICRTVSNVICGGTKAGRAGEAAEPAEAAPVEEEVANEGEAGAAEPAPAPPMMR